jgi:IclR family KDG regulon transcriptional repressor
LTDYTIAVVKDTLIVLDLIGKSIKGMTLTEVTDVSGLGKNKVFRILYTLQESHMIYKDENGRSHLGMRISELAQNVHVHDLLLDISSPIMDELVELTQESIILGVILDTNALCIATKESPRSMRLFARVGIQSPLYKGGVPKVLLANMDAKDREKLLTYFERDLNALHEQVDWVKLSEKLTHIRMAGYSITVNELDEGAHSITAPIFNSKGQVLAAMSIAGPSIRFSDEAIEHCISAILEATDRISSALGYKTINQPLIGNNILTGFS